MDDNVEQQAPADNEPAELPHSYWAAVWLLRIVLEDFEGMKLDDLSPGARAATLKRSEAVLRVTTKAFLAANDRGFPAMVILTFVGALRAAAEVQEIYAGNRGLPPDAPAVLREAGQFGWRHFCEHTPWCPREVLFQGEPIANELGRQSAVWKLNKKASWTRTREMLCCVQAAINEAIPGAWPEDVPNEGRLEDIWKKDRTEVQVKRLAQGKPQDPPEPL